MTDIRPAITDENEDLRAREKKLPKVRTTSGTMIPFEAGQIIDSLVLEANLSRPDAHLIATRVMDRITASGIKFLSGPLIREMCNSVLAEFGMEQERVRYTRVGVPMYDLDLLINSTGEHTNNANLMRNPESIAKLVHDQVMEQHTYLSIPSHLADAHLSGDIYIKDREYFSTRDYCATWDLRQVLKLGIAPDGLGGLHSSAAGPAQHLNVAVNHSAIWLAAAQSSFAGGQGYFYYNTFLAPFMEGLSYKKIKQAAQQLIFTLTQQYVARGGQVIFSSVDLTPGIPKIMRDVSAVLPGGRETEATYGDYEDEARKFFDAFMDIMLKGDSKGKGFNFPKPNIVLREEFMKPEFDESWSKVAALTAKFGSPYFENYLNWRSSIEAGCSSCCSHLWTASSDEELEEFLTGKGQPYIVETACDGIEAMEKLEANSAKYDIVLLDRMMPRMSGMEVLEKMSAHPELKYIPVILQTAKVSKEDILEGLKAGAYYYLTKPFTSDILHSVVKTAVKDRGYNKALLASLNVTKSSVKLLKNAHFEFRSLDDVRAVSSLIACACDEPDKIAMGLSELMINAIEHGNLHIGYEEKSTLRKTDKWESEIANRLELPEYKQKFASVDILNNSDGVTYTISDQGTGFDWDEFMEFDTARVMDNHGRGIAMANKLYFSKLEYQGNGNTVVVMVEKLYGEKH